MLFPPCPAQIGRARLGPTYGALPNYTNKCHSDFLSLDVVCAKQMLRRPAFAQGVGPELASRYIEEGLAVQVLQI